MGRGKSYRKFTIKMQKKLVVLFIAVLLAFAGLFYQLYRISRDNGEQYKKQVLSQQRYDSTTIPYKRGTILDANGSVLATSEKVYNVILDSVAISEKEEYLEPTLSALQREFGIDTASIRDYIEKNKETSRYHVLAKRLSYSEISDFLDMQNEEGSQIKGIWFDEEYKRVYPGNSLACDVIGFTADGLILLSAYITTISQSGSIFNFLEISVNFNRNSSVLFFIYSLYIILIER